MDTGKLIKYETLPQQGELGFSPEALERLRFLLQNPTLFEQLMRCVDRVSSVERWVQTFDERCRTLTSQCNLYEMMCKQVLCPGNVNYSQPTLDEYSAKAQVKMTDPVPNLGGDFVNNYPVPPGKKIRLTHKPRPGYTPYEIRIDLNVAGGGTNYSDFTLQFYLVPGGQNSVLGKEIGDEYNGHQFLNKNGTQIAVPFPQYRNMPIDVGSLETLAIVISNNGAVNNLDSAYVSVFYDNTRFYEMCKVRCSGGCPSPSAPPM